MIGLLIRRLTKPDRLCLNHPQDPPGGRVGREVYSRHAKLPYRGHSVRDSTKKHPQERSLDPTSPVVSRLLLERNNPRKLPQPRAGCKPATLEA